MIYTTKEEIHKRALEAIGIPFKDMNPSIDEDSLKGGIGQMIEKYWFGYNPNSRAEADFPEAGVELKVSGFIRLAGGDIKAKERLVLNIINYEKEYGKDFYDSSFWHKNNFLELMFYEYLKDSVSKALWSIHTAFQFTYPKKDLIIIKQDYEKIIYKINNNLAHELSEGDTLYLGACTKGANSSSMRTQIGTEILAKQRAYCLKQSYLTEILKAHMNSNNFEEELITDTHELAQNGFEKVIENKLSKYKNTNITELARIFSISNMNSKGILHTLVSRMLGINGNLSNASEIVKADITIKTIRLNSNGTLTESMSFPYFNPCTIANQTWEESDFYEALTKKFLFVIYQTDENGDTIFKGIKFWNMPNNDLDEAQKVWEKTAEIFREDTLILNPTLHGISNNLPSKSENRVCHVRPHARNANDTILIPSGMQITKQCFWLNNTYILSIIGE